MKRHAIIIYACFGGMLGSAGCNYFLTYKHLFACQKQHNVYQCKMVAVPVEKEK